MRVFIKDLGSNIVEAWLAYHRTADKIDGHIRRPTNKEEGELVHLAARCGLSARNDIMNKYGLMHMPKDVKLWNTAKLDALRIVERESKHDRHQTR